jgi:hypothetical protein
MVYSEFHRIAYQHSRRPRIMNRRKTLVACLPIVLGVLALSAISVPRANAFAQSINVSLSGLGVSGFADPTTGVTVDGIGSGSTLTVTVVIVANSYSPAYQRNITVGFEGDWMSQYQNASNASPSSTMALSSAAQGTATISVTMPSTGGLTDHTWTVAVWDGAANSLNGATCFAGNNPAGPSAACDLITYSSAGYDQLAIYTSNQLSAAEDSVQAASSISYTNTALTTLVGVSLKTPPPGATAAAGDLAQANTQMALGSQSWKNGDYSGAQTHYQNALNDANAAASSLTGQGGGTDEANLVNLILGGTGIMLVGIGALLAGLGVLVRYMRKPKV